MTKGSLITQNALSGEVLKIARMPKSLQDKRKMISPRTLYRGQKAGGSYLAQTLRKNTSRWINSSPLDAKGKAPPGAINGAS